MQCRRPRFDSWVRKLPWRRDRLPTPGFLGFPGGSAGKESASNAGDLGLTRGSGRSPGEGKGYPLLDSGLENFMDSIVHGVTKSWTRLSDFHFTKITTRDEEKVACLSCNSLQNNMKQNEKNVIYLCMFSQNIWSHSKDTNRKEKLGIKIRVI